MDQARSASDKIEPSQSHALSPSPGPGPAFGPAVGPAPDLRGTLPCARCSYDLQGLSITSICPECSLPVRATILTRVDPQAHELRPLFFPRLTAWGMMLWSGAALASALCAWVLKGSELSGRAFAPQGLKGMVVAFAGLSALGALVMVHPHAWRVAPNALPRQGIAGTRASMLLACVGVACGVLVALALGVVYLQHHPPVVHSMWRLLALLAMACSLLCLRPNARLLASRSFLMRTGQIDRQQMASMVAVLGVWGVGESLRLLVLRNPLAQPELVRLLAEILVMVGATLFTLGLISLCIDTLRMRRVLADRPLSLRQLL